MKLYEDLSHEEMINLINNKKFKIDSGIASTLVDTDGETYTDFQVEISLNGKAVHLLVSNDEGNYAVSEELFYTSPALNALFIEGSNHYTNVLSEAEFQFLSDNAKALFNI